MPTSYDRIAGQSVERLAALSDGLFGVAMTLLLLNLQVPDRPAQVSEILLLRALASGLPGLLVYLMSFLTLGIFWVGQQTQLNYLRHSQRHLTWLHLLFLFAVTLVPFSTRLLASFIEYRTALLVYWANIFVLGLMLFLAWAWAIHAKVVDPDLSPQVKSVIFRRIISSQSLYAAGAAMCLISTYLSIGFIVLVQLAYVTGASQWFATLGSVADVASDASPHITSAEITSADVTSADVASRAT
jgi:uncharacterized membrane protein